MNKKISNGVKIIIIAGMFFAGYNFSLAAGCCIPPPPGACFVSNDVLIERCPSSATYNSAPCSTITVCTEDLTQLKKDQGSECTASSQCGGSAEENNYCIKVDNGKYALVDGSSGGGHCMPYSVVGSDSDAPNEDKSKQAGAAGGGSCPAGTVCFDNPVGANNLLDLVGNILNGLRSVIVVIAIVFIVIGGIMYMSSAGSEKMIDRAKAIIGGALIGLAIVLAAPTFLKEIITILGNASGGDPNEVISRALTLKEIAIRTLNFLLSVVGALGIIGLVVGGFFYLTSYGAEDRIEKGKEIISASLIGIAITLAAVIIVRQIATLIGG